VTLHTGSQSLEQCATSMNSIAGGYSGDHVKARKSARAAVPAAPSKAMAAAVR
jgi:hypothetical protein